MQLNEYLDTLDITPKVRQVYRSNGKALACALANQSGCLEGQPAQPITKQRLQDAARDCGLDAVPGFFMDWMRTLV